MKAYTLIELIIAVLLMVMILLGGTAIFYQSLKSSGLSDVNANLDNTLQSILHGMEKDLRYSKVDYLNDKTRLDCIGAGATGLTGDTLKVSDLNGQQAIYSLQNGKIASTSAQTNDVTYLNSGQIEVLSLQFTWFCQPNISDKMDIAVEASSSALGSGIGVNRKVDLQITLLNSGLN